MISNKIFQLFLISTAVTLASGGNFLLNDSCLEIERGTCQCLPEKAGCPAGSVIDKEYFYRKVISLFNVFPHIENHYRPNTLCAFGNNRCCAAKSKLPYTPAVACGLRKAADKQRADPWQVAIFNAKKFIGLGVLLDSFHILTLGTIVKAYENSAHLLKVRLGDSSSYKSTESRDYWDSCVSSVTIHPNFTNADENYKIYNNVALVRLSRSINIHNHPYLNFVCKPTYVPEEGHKCYVYKYVRSTVSKLVHVVDTNALLMKNEKCEKPDFVLDKTNFTCALSNEEDYCRKGKNLNYEVQIGAPLVCENSDEQKFVVGLAITNDKCRENPDVYVNILSYVPWINQVTVSYRMEIQKAFQFVGEKKENKEDARKK